MGTSRTRSAGSGVGVGTRGSGVRVATVGVEQLVTPLLRVEGFQTGIRELVDCPQQQWCRLARDAILTLVAHGLHAGAHLGQPFATVDTVQIGYGTAVARDHASP